MTRSETNQMHLKSLRTVLPRGSEIAVILDDREDVWRESIENLLPVAPYYFFKGVGAHSQHWGTVEAVDTAVFLVALKLF